MSLGGKFNPGPVPDFSGGSGGFQQGLKAAQMLTGQYESGYDTGRRNKARQAFGEAWGKGDPESVQKVMAMYPEYAKQAQEMIGIRDDQHRKDVGSLTSRLHGLLSGGDIEGAKSLVDQSRGLFDKAGPYSADSVIERLGSGDKKAIDAIDKWAQSTTLSTLKPLEIIKEGDAQQRFGLDKQRLDQNYDLSNKRIGLGYDRLQHQDAWRQLAHEDRLAGLGAQSSASDRAERRLRTQEERQIHSEINDTIKGPKQKQYYMNMAEKAMNDLEGYVKSGNKAGAAEAYHNVRNNIARASLGGNATLTEGQIEQSTGLPAFFDEKANSLGLKTNGMPSKMFISSTKQQIKDDLKNERATLAQQGKQFYQSLRDEGYSDEDAKRYIDHGMMGTGLGPQDWSDPHPSETPGSDKKDKKADHSDLWGG